jgi:hypothetical protein
MNTFSKIARYKIRSISIQNNKNSKKESRKQNHPQCNQTIKILKNIFNEGSEGLIQ